MLTSQSALFSRRRTSIGLVQILEILTPGKVPQHSGSVLTSPKRRRTVALSRLQRVKWSEVLYAATNKSVLWRAARQVNNVESDTYMPDNPSRHGNAGPCKRYLITIIISSRQREAKGRVQLYFLLLNHVIIETLWKFFVNWCWPSHEHRFVTNFTFWGEATVLPVLGHPIGYKIPASR